MAANRGWTAEKGTEGIDFERAKIHGHVARFEIEKASLRAFAKAYEFPQSRFPLRSNLSEAVVMTTETDLIHKNMQVLSLVQALLGSITNNLRAVSIHCASQGVALTLVLFHESLECREEIDDIVFEFEALQFRNIGVTVDVIVDARPYEEIRLKGRLVFLRK